MESHKARFSVHFIFAIFALLLFVLTSQAQTDAQKAKAPGESKPEEKAGNDLEQLKSKLEMLQSLVEQQQRAMTEMQKRIDELDDKARAAIVAPASMKVDTATGAQPEPETASLEAAQTQKSDPPSSPVARDKDKDKPALLAGWDRNHAFLRSADGAFETQITGYGQLDFRGYQSGNHPPNTFLVRRARLALEGDRVRSPNPLDRNFFVVLSRIQVAF